MVKVQYLAVVSFLVLAISLFAWWSMHTTFFSVEFGLAELSPNGSEGGYAVPASGASTPSGLRYSCANDGKKVTLQWSRSSYQGYLPSEDKGFAYNLGTLLSQSIFIPTVYAGGGGDSDGGGGGGSIHGHAVPAPVTYDIYLNGKRIKSNHSDNSYKVNITPDKDYSWGVRACAGGECSSQRTSSFSCPGLPELNFSADSYEILYHESTNLRWSSIRTNSCVASGAWSGNKNISGSEGTGILKKPTNYFMQCTGPRGSTGTKSVRIGIIYGTGADISACKSVVYKDEEFCINYDVGTSKPQYCLIQAGSHTIAGPFSETQGTIDWSISGETTFTLNCEEGGNTDSTTVKVLPEFQET